MRDSMKYEKSLFFIYDSCGLPFEIMFLELRTNHLRPNMAKLILEARQAGWKEKKIESSILSAFGDIYGPEDLKFVTDYIHLLEMPEVIEFCKDAPSILVPNLPKMIDELLEKLSDV